MMQVGLNKKKSISEKIFLAFYNPVVFITTVPRRIGYFYICYIRKPKIGITLYPDIALDMTDKSYYTWLTMRKNKKPEKVTLFSPRSINEGVGYLRYILSPIDSESEDKEK